MKSRKAEQEGFRLPFLYLGGVALVAGLTPDTVFLLVKKRMPHPSVEFTGQDDL